MRPIERNISALAIIAASVIALSGCGDEFLVSADTVADSPRNPVELDWTAPTDAPADVLPAVASIDALELAQWLGTWYQVAHIPAWFDAFCVAGTTAEYSLDSTGDVIVRNGCFDRDGILREQIGLAKLLDPAEPARLSVAFFGLDPVEAGGDYWVLDRDGYEFAVVGEPSRRYGWILSRSPAVTQAQADRAIAVLLRQGYDLGDFEPTDQTPYLPTAD